MADKVSDQTLSDLVTGGTNVAIGNRTARVYKFDSAGNAINVSPEDAAREAVTSLSEPKGNAVAHAANWFGEHLGNVAGAAGYGADKLLNPALRAVGFEPTPFNSLEEAQAKARGLTPHSPAGVALTMATGTPAFNAMRLGPRIATGAAIGAGAEGAGGGDPLIGAGGGVAAATVPQATSAVLKWLTGLPSRYITSKGVDALEEGGAGKFLNWLRSSVPELADAAKGSSNSERVLSLRDPDLGRKALGQIMQSSEDSAVSALPQAQVAMPVTGAQGLQPGQTPKMAALGIQGPQAGPNSISLREAFDKVKELKMESRLLMRGPEPLKGRQAMLQADALEGNILNTLQAGGAPIAQAWQQAMAKYDTGLRALELAKAATGSGATSATQTPFSTGDLVRHFLTNAEDFSSARMPGFAEHMFGGAQTGTSPQITDPGLYARFFGGGGMGHVKGNVPTPKFVTEPGHNYGIGLPPVSIAAPLAGFGEQVQPR